MSKRSNTLQNFPRQQMACQYCGYPMEVGVGRMVEVPKKDNPLEKTDHKNKDQVAKYHAKCRLLGRQEEIKNRKRAQHAKNSEK